MFRVRIALSFGIVVFLTNLFPTFGYTANNFNWSMFTPAIVGSGIFKDFVEKIETSSIPIYTPERGWLQYTTSGTIGMTYTLVQKKDGTLYEHQLILLQRRPNGSRTKEIVETQILEKSYCQTPCELRFDSQSRPHLFRRAYRVEGQNLIQWYQHGYKTEGSWEWEDIDLGYDSRLFYVAVTIGPDDVIHLLGRDDSVFISVKYYHFSNAGGIWSKELIERVGYQSSITPLRMDISISPEGNTHAVYKDEYDLQNTPSGWSGELRYSTNKNQTWQSTIITGPADSADFTGSHPDLALSPATGLPHVLSTYKKQSPTSGSLTSSALYSHILEGDGSWSSKVLVENADKYCWDDGCGFSGMWPSQVMDSRGRQHVVFQDAASSHKYSMLLYGQIRYGLHDGTGWHFSNLYRQPSPQGPDNYSALSYPAIAIRPHGDRLFAAGVEQVRVQGLDTYTLLLISRATNGDNL